MIAMKVDETTSSAGRGWRLHSIAGIGFTVSWIAGLMIFSSSTRVNSSGTDVLRGIAGHHTVVALQYLLTEGTAAIALALVVVALGRAAGTPWLVLIGLGAAAVSLA